MKKKKVHGRNKTIKGANKKYSKKSLISLKIKEDIASMK